jgi:hypothetical protein
MHKYGGPTMADIASFVISGGLVKQHLLSPEGKMYKPQSHSQDVLWWSGVNWHKMAKYLIIFKHKNKIADIKSEN